MSSLPVVTVYTRHSANCIKDGKKPESWRACNCWKWLRIKHVNGSLERQATKIRTWAGHPPRPGLISQKLENRRHRKCHESEGVGATEDFLRVRLRVAHGH